MSCSDTAINANCSDHPDEKGIETPQDNIVSIRLAGDCSDHPDEKENETMFLLV